MSVGKRIKATRESRGMSSTALAGILKISVSAISNWEAEKATPRTPMLEKASQALGVSREFLEFGTVDTQSNDFGVETILNNAKNELANLMRVSRDRITLSLGMTS